MTVGLSSDCVTRPIASGRDTGLKVSPGRGLQCCTQSLRGGSSCLGLCRALLVVHACVGSLMGPCSRSGWRAGAASNHLRAFWPGPQLSCCCLSPMPMVGSYESSSSLLTPLHQSWLVLGWVGTARDCTPPGWRFRLLHCPGRSQSNPTHPDLLRRAGCSWDLFTCVSAWQLLQHKEPRRRLRLGARVSAPGALNKAQLQVQQTGHGRYCFPVIQAGLHLGRLEVLDGLMRGQGGLLLSQLCSLGLLIILLQPHSLVSGSQ